MDKPPAWRRQRSKPRRAAALAELSDEQLMASVRHGDERAFEELYERYAGRILRFATRLLRDQQEAESVTQDVFLRLLERSGTYDPQRQLSTWIYTIARNLCLDVLARSRPALIGELERFASNEPDPACFAEDQEMGHRLRAAIDALPPSAREMIQLRIFEGLSYREIAEIVGCPESTARSRMNLAIRRLRGFFCRSAAIWGNRVDESASGP